MVIRSLSPLMCLAMLLAPFGCRSPDELLEDVNVTVLVIGVEEDQLAEIVVNAESLRARAVNDVATFALSVDAGDYQGAVTIFKVDSDIEDDVDDVENAFLEADRCGSFSVSASDTPTTVGVLVDDLERCGEDDEDSPVEAEVEGESDPSEGEGEGEGEVEDPEDPPEPPSEGEGEGEGE